MPGSAEIDWFALTLVLLQAVLLYHIAVKAEGLRGPRLLAAAKAARATAAARAEKLAGERRVAMDTLEPSKRAKLDRVRAAYAEVGSLDELWEPFLTRFLVAADWDEEEAMRKLLVTATWRRDHGAAGIRRKFTKGFKLSEHPAFMRQLSTIGMALTHRRANDGDVFSLGQIGSFDPDAWLNALSDDDFFDVGLHICEYLAYRADHFSRAERSVCHIIHGH